MTATRSEQVIPLPIVGYYDAQRVIQFNSTDAANWTLIENPLAKGLQQNAMYPAMGRRIVRYLNSVKLIFPIQPREAFVTVNYSYFIVGSDIFRVDRFFNQVQITNPTNQLSTVTGDVYADYLVVGSETFVGFCDGQNMYVYQETAGKFELAPYTEASNAFGPPKNAQYIAAFGNRFVVAGANTAQFFLTEINLTANTYDVNNIFNVANEYVFASEVGIIRQMGVYQNTLYIFSDYKTGLWSNRPTSLQSYGGTIVSFPFQRSTSIEFDRGIADGKTLDVAFDRMCWVSKSKKGLLEAVVLIGSQPERISTKAIDVLFQKELEAAEVASPFLTERLSAFMYEYENTVFYRLNAGNWSKNIRSNQENRLASTVEFNFEVKQWSRAIEKDGQRNRAQRMIYFANRNLVTVQGENTVYEFTGKAYTNDLRDNTVSNPNDADAYIHEPFRYERVTPIITIKNLNEIGYAEFATEYVEIDFAYGIYSSRLMNAPFQNAVFLVDETSDANGAPVYLTTEDNSEQLLITENSNLPVLTDETYYNWWKPHIELLYSDDGGVSYKSADVQRFSDLGVYEWRMRWYNLETSRNRCYKLVCVSRSPIFVLGGCTKVKRISGGAD